MRQHGGTLELSATDLSNFLGCRHRTALDMAVASGALERPEKEPDPLLELLWKRGLEHEALYVEKLKAAGRPIVDLREFETDRDTHVAKTLEAMHASSDVIVQGALRDGRWFGKPDVMLRVAKPSDLGDWSYEVADTKLSRETKAGTILQLGLYSEMLALAQGTRPDRFHVVTPYAEHEYRLNDYAAYFRMIRQQMLDTAALDHEDVARDHYPEPVAHCDICQWAIRCAKRRRDDDHLSLVANISRLHRRELESRDIRTLTQLAGIPVPIEFKPTRGSVETYVRVRQQARLQFESRDLRVPRFELREIVEDKNEGLCRLPEPSPGDIFLDLEGDAFATEGGREYLFGLACPREGGEGPVFEYRAFWGLTEKQERESFEKVMDLIMSTWKQHPDMHIYHYAPYETTAFGKLAGRYVTRQNDFDNLLRAGRFVDLYGVIRQGMFVGTERYSIKNLEPLYGFERAVRLADANRCLRVIEQALETNSPASIPPDVRDAVRGYNEDDCVSTLRLRDWLETVRSDHLAKGWDIPRPAPPEDDARELNDRELKVNALRAQLLTGVPEVREERSAEQQARWLLAYLLDYHNREAKAVWWEYFRLRKLPEEDLHDEPQAIAGMEFVERVHTRLNKRTGRPTGTVIDRYRYPPQEMEIERGDLKLKEGDFGKLVAQDRKARTVDVEKVTKHAEFHPTSVFAHTYIATKAQEDSLFAIGERVVQDGGVVLGGRDRVARALLLAMPPDPLPERARGPLLDVVKYLRDTVLSLDHSVLPVQGPPGAGKTYAGAEMICALVSAGKKVGIAASSHKVIRNLLDEVLNAAKRNGKQIRIAQRFGEDEFEVSPDITRLNDNKEAARALKEAEADVVGGTSWVWAHGDLCDSIDVLFVDEAGQMALANVLSMAPCAESIVLLGDPQQLEQPRKGSHPDGVGVSALGHMLSGHATVPDDRGVFLPQTWRMCPKITEFTSEMFYESRLDARPGLEVQRLDGASEFNGAGLWMVNMEHDGNRTSSMEEIEAVAGLVERLTSTGVTWTNKDGNCKPIAGRDILIVAPYNAHVSRLTERVAATGARVGTVDKFQGQEAPIVIFSMATSRPEDAPRGMEFLYSLNRLNVATSRARCAAIVVASARLFEPECRTPRQMKLANALCRYRELSGHP